MSRGEGVDKIMEALDEHFIRAMRNWARWFVGSSEAYSSTSAYDGVSVDCWGDNSIPILSGEATDVDTALHAIDQRYRHAVMIFWTHEGESLPRMAQRIRPALHFETAQRWVMRGHEELRAELSRRRAAVAHARRLNERETSNA